MASPTAPGILQLVYLTRFSCRKSGYVLCSFIFSSMRSIKLALHVYFPYNDSKFNKFQRNRNYKLTGVKFCCILCVISFSHINISQMLIVFFELLCTFMVSMVYGFEHIYLRSIANNTLFSIGISSTNIGPNRYEKTDLF